MDVTSTAVAAAPPVPVVATGSAAAPAPPLPDSSGQQSQSAAPIAPTAAVGTPNSAGAPPSVGFGPAPANGDGKVVSSVARFFGPPSNPHPITLNVSYRVLQHPNEIVTVFSDPRTNQEVAQFPPEILIGIAEFFDQHQGVTLDSNA